VGVVQSEETDASKHGREYVFDINKYRENMAIDCPVRDGLVVDWDAMEKLWEHAVSKYCGRGDSSLKDTPVLLSEKPYVPVAVRHR
jgi:actin-related protein